MGSSPARRLLLGALLCALVAFGVPAGVAVSAGRPAARTKASYRAVRVKWGVHVESGRQRRHARRRHRARPLTGHSRIVRRTSGSPAPPQAPPKVSGVSSSGSSEPSPSGSTSPSDPFASGHFYVDPHSSAAATESEWASQGRSAEASQIAKIATRPTAQWFGNWSYGHGGTAGDVGWWVGLASAAGTLPVLVAYDIPWRDCGQYSSGGASEASAYEQFISAMAQGIAGRPAVVILEPDALPELGCLNSEQQGTYYRLLKFAVGKLSSSASTAVYLDAGNAGWQSAATMAARLRQAGVSGARGFSLNVSNFDSTASETAYGEAIDRELGGGAHFIVDTSRNGRGPAPGGAWCNPPGRGLGAAPTAQTGNPLVDAYFWVKRPGESDGTCDGGPSAGQWWPSYALELAENSAP